jgi:methionyl-tRNA synthetase
VAEWMNVARLGNKYLADNEPWKKITTDEERVKTIMNVALQISASLAILSEPFLPFTSAKLFGLLNLQPLRWLSARQTSNMPAGHRINKDELLFARIEDVEITAQLEKLRESKNANSKNMAKEIKPTTTFDEFSKMDIRTATILKAEAVPKTDKLLKLLLDTGVDQRVVVSGIAAYYKPEDIIGHKVCLLANLEPRKIKGIESQGMILMAENSNGELCFVSPVKNDFENGSAVK